MVFDIACYGNVRCGTELATESMFSVLSSFFTQENTGFVLVDGRYA